MLYIFINFWSLTRGTLVSLTSRSKDDTLGAQTNGKSLDFLLGSIAFPDQYLYLDEYNYEYSYELVEELDNVWEEYEEEDTSCPEYFFTHC